MSENKHLNLTELRKQDKKYDKKFEIVVENDEGDEYSLKVDENFRNSKIDDMIYEAFKIWDYARTNEYAIEDIYEKYVMLLVIKHFTSLKVPDEFEKQIDVFRMLVDNNFLMQIINSIPEKEMQKVNERIEGATQNVDKFMDEYENMNLDNKDILRDVEDGEEL